ncbi:multidrug effflux MFS transporter [Oricola sp.]|uniref:multidrug effflux MFS transporter n=1 Tax=Oricola sp. TaxID=1979950 RepID=UPI003BACA0F7
MTARFEAGSAEQNHSGPRPSLLTLILLSAVSPLAMNVFVPSMPSIAADFDAPYAQVQLGLSLYLIMVAAMQVVAGPLSDTYGRKPVILTGVIMFMIGTAMCLWAQSVPVFLAGRVIQAGSAVGLVLSRTIVRDIYPREKSASMIGYMVMGMAVAPMLGPALGGFIDQFAGWRMSFVLLGVFGLFSLATVLFNLPETNRYRGTPLREQLAAYRMLAADPLFWSYAAATSLVSAMFFSYLGGGPAVATTHFGLGPGMTGIYFAIVAIGYIFGNFLSGRFSERRGLERMILDGTIIGASGPGLIVLSLAFGFDNPLAVFLPVALIGVGNGMALPNATAAAISLRPEVAGAASGLLGTAQVGLGAAVSIVAGILVGAHGSPLALGLLLLLFGVASIVASVLASRLSRAR